MPRIYYKYSSNPSLTGVGAWLQNPKVLVIGQSNQLTEAKNTMKKLRLILLAFAAAVLPSCMTIDSLLTVNVDGSGTLVEKIVLEEAAKSMMSAAGGADLLLDEAAYKKRGEQLGAEFVGVKKIEGKKDGVEASYKFADISKLKYTPSDGGMAGGDEEGDAPAEEVKPMTFEFTAGSPAKLKVILPEDFLNMKENANQGGGDEEGDDEMADAMADGMLAMMAPMFKDMKMRSRIKCGSDIVKTDATISKGNEVVLMFMDFGKVVGSEGGLKKLMSMDGKDPEAINKMPGIMMELKDSFEVEFK